MDVTLLSDRIRIATRGGSTVLLGKYMYACRYSTKGGSAPGQAGIFYSVSIYFDEGKGPVNLDTGERVDTFTFDLQAVSKASQPTWANTERGAQNAVEAIAPILRAEEDCCPPQGVLDLRGLDCENVFDEKYGVTDELLRGCIIPGIDFCDEDNRNALTPEQIECICDIPPPPLCPIDIEVRNSEGTLVDSQNIPDPCLQVGPVELGAPDATVTFDGQPLITVPSGATDNITCNSLVNAAYVQDGGSRTGTYKVDGTVNGKDRYRLDGTHTLEYSGTRWAGVVPGPDVEAAPGNEDFPWQADWSGTDIVVTQASIAQYCDQCDPPTLCELLAAVLPENAQEEVLDCVTPETWTAIRIAQVCDLDAQAYLARVEAADGDYLEQAYRDAVCDLVLGLKADGLWNALSDFVPLIGARTLAGALVPLKGATPLNIGFVTGDYVRKQGLKGDGSTKHLNTRRNINEFPQDSIHASVYVHTQQTLGASGAYMGGGASVINGAIGILRQISGNVFQRNRNTTNNDLGTSGSGFIGHSRSAGASYTARINSTNQTVTQASQAPGSIEIYAFAQSTLSGGVPIPVTHTDGRIACYTIGTSLTLATLQSRVDAFIAAVNSTIP